MNTFGTIFRVSIFGESHGEQIGVVVDGVQPGIPLCEEDFKADLARRRSGAKGTTPRIEADEPHILSGVFEGYTTGAPLAIVFHNTNTHSQDYELLKAVPRPGHADYTANLKYGGFQDPRGGGHFSGRLTLPVVAAGVVAKRLLSGVLASATRGRVQFQCDAARSGKEVKGIGRILFKIDIGTEDIEQVLLGEVRSGTRLEGTGDVEVTTTVFPCNNSHSLIR